MQQQSFFYKGVKDDGHQVSGVVVADSKAEAIEKISEHNLHVLYIKKTHKLSRMNIGHIRLSSKEKIAFFLHISEMARAGMKTTQSLNLLIDLSENKKILKLATMIKDKVDQGKSFSDSMQEIGAFGDIFPNLVFAAEKTNSLDTVGEMIVSYIKWIDDMKRYVKNAIFKPLFSLLFMLCGIMGMAIFVMPKMLDTLNQLNNGNGLPALTTNFIAFTSFIQRNWYFMIIIIALLLILNFIPRLFGMKKTTAFIDKVKLKMPIFGTLFLKIEIARLSAFLSILLNSGYRANEAIPMAPRVIHNEYVKYNVKQAGYLMDSGATLHSAFGGFPLFPKFFVSMIGIGENVNNVSKTIMNIKEAYDKEVATTVDMVISSVKPMITILSGFFIAWMGLAVFSPMYGTISNISSSMH